jgi:prepilin-type N-terminal cleavage/methylation domain-containing protein
MNRSLRRTPSRPTGFTLVEVLVVVGVIAALLGLLMAGLQAASKASRKTKQMSDLRQLYTAWSAYAGTYNDYIIPGKLDVGAQTRWRVKYKYKTGGRVDPSLAVDYPFRLMPYLDWNFSTLYGYFPDFDSWYPPVNGELGNIPEGAGRVASSPAFGYNAYYIGGSWSTDEAGNTALDFENSEWDMSVSDGTSVPIRGKLVARTIGNITQPSNMVIFCSSILRDAGVYKTSSEFSRGSSLVVPHIFADTEIWGPYTGQLGGSTGPSLAPITADLSGSALSSRVLGAAGVPIRMEVFSAGSVPYRRFSDTIPVLHGDGNTSAFSLTQLLDQRKWINGAHDGVQNPTKFSHTP